MGGEKEEEEEEEEEGEEKYSTCLKINDLYPNITQPIPVWHVQQKEAQYDIPVLVLFLDY